MKVSNTASSVRAQMTAAEAREIVDLVERARLSNIYVPQRLIDAATLLEIRAGDVRAAQADKAAQRDRAKRVEAERRDRERQFMIGEGYSVMASRGDYADVSSEPDFRQWVDLVLQEILSRPIPDQCEIRRDVWIVRVVRLTPGDWGGIIVGSDCTATNNPEEIEQLARAIIESGEVARLEQAA